MQPARKAALPTCLRELRRGERRVREGDGVQAQHGLPACRPAFQQRARQADVHRVARAVVIAWHEAGTPSARDQYAVSKQLARGCPSCRDTRPRPQQFRRPLSIHHCTCLDAWATPPLGSVSARATYVPDGIRKKGSSVMTHVPARIFWLANTPRPAARAIQMRGI